MAKFNLKKVINNVNDQLIKYDVREKLFLFVTSAIMFILCAGASVVNFINNENVLGYCTIGFGVTFLIMLVVQFFVFNKYKDIKNLPFAIIITILMVSLAILYVFLAPIKALYLFWIVVIPVLFCLAFDIKYGLATSLGLLLAIALALFVPAFSALTRADPASGDTVVVEIFLILDYSLSLLIGLVLAAVNKTIITRLDLLKDVYYKEANTDIVTGLSNQAYYLSYINNLNLVVKKGESVGLMFIDIDDFKIYNDKYGHTVGNEVLIAVAKKLNEVPHALCARWGGDEFAIVERNLTKDEFIAKANYLLKSVEGLPGKVTISIGLAYYVVDDDFDFNKIFNEADMQAIRAKGKGKNCIVINN